MPEQYRRCRKCRVEKSIEDFYRSKGRALGRAYVCKACALEEAHRPERRERRRQYSAERYRRGREILNEMKSGPCVDCGGTFPPVAMEFDHPDPTIKMFDISTWAGGGISPKLLEELAKTDLICSNCHRIRTHKQIRDGVLRRGGRPRKAAS